MSNSGYTVTGIFTLKDNFSVAARNIKLSGARLASEMTRLTTGVGSLGTAFTGLISPGGLAAGAIMGVGYALMNGIRSGAQFADQMNEVRRVSGATAAEVESISQAVLKLSEHTRFTAKDLAKIGTVGAQSGINTGDLPLYIDKVQQLANALGMPAEATALQFAKIGQAMHKNVAEMGEYMAYLNVMENVSPARAFEMISAMRRAASIAGIMNISDRDYMAIAGTLVSSSVDPGRAGRALTSGFTKLHDADYANEKNPIHGLLAEIGLESRQVSEAFKVDGGQAFLNVLERIAAKPLFEQSHIITGIFGKDFNKVMAPLVANTANLRHYMDTLRMTTPAQAAATVRVEAGMRTDTLMGKWEVLVNQWNALMIKATNALTPFASALIDVASFLLKLVSTAAYAISIIAHPIDAAFEGKYAKLFSMITEQDKPNITKEDLALRQQSKDIISGQRKNDGITPNGSLSGKPAPLDIKVNVSADPGLKVSTTVNGKSNLGASGIGQPLAPMAK